ncbi:MAG TPA: hypothetical protein VEB59_16010 [Gemmatimonadales bacterium]|nr:hypothetical protein [Gemmatimonadales bacterium]
MKPGIPVMLMLVGAATLACGSTDVCACEFGGATVIVYGTVSSPEGEGVGNATVRVESHPGEGCSDLPASGMSDSRSGADFGGAGLYRVDVIAFEEGTQVCLTVRATPPLDATGLGESAPVEIVADFAFSGEPDSVEVPLTLSRSETD